MKIIIDINGIPWILGRMMVDYPDGRREETDGMLRADSIESAAGITDDDEEATHITTTSGEHYIFLGSFLELSADMLAPETET